MIDPPTTKREAAQRRKDVFALGVGAGTLLRYRPRATKEAGQMEALADEIMESVYEFENNHERKP